MLRVLFALTLVTIASGAAHAHQGQNGRKGGGPGPSTGVYVPLRGAGSYSGGYRSDNSFSPPTNHPAGSAADFVYRQQHQVLTNVYGSRAATQLLHNAGWRR